MKKVLLTMLAVSMLASVGTAGHLKNMSDQSSASIAESAGAVSGSLQFSVDKSGEALTWLGNQSESALTESEASVSEIVTISGDALQASLTLSTNVGSFVLNVVLGSSSLTAKVIQAAYQEGRAVNVTIVNPGYIARAANGSLGQKALGVSGQSLNKSVETSGSVAVSIAASVVGSVDQIVKVVVSPKTLTQEGRSVRQAR